MKDEGRVVDDVNPAALAAAQAQVVLLAVAEAERLFVERTYIVQVGSLHVHAEAVGRRCLRTAAAGETSNGASYVIHRPSFGDGVSSVRLWDCEDGAAVGERWAGPDAGVRVRTRPKALEPVWGDDGVAVEDDDVMRLGERESPVHGPDEAQVLVVAPQLDPSRRCQPVEERSGFGGGARVVDHQDAVLGRGAPDDRLDAHLDEFNPSVDRDDDVNGRRARPGHGLLARAGGSGRAR